jgi:transposase-like protein
MPLSLFAFRPPFCPRSYCPSHSGDVAWTYKRAGSYLRKAAPQRIPRYTCVVCGANFSYQTFQTTYWLKRPDLLTPLVNRLVACSGFRQIARDFGVSHTTVMRLSERLGRHCLLFLWRDLQRIKLGEPVAIDGFESFAHSQFYPCHFHLAVGADSHFTYAFTDSELRRKGRMTEGQKRRRAELEQLHGRPDPRSIEKEIAELVKLLPETQAGPVRVLSDEHPAYPRGLKRAGVEVLHQVTPSTAPRTSANPLFPVNVMDLLIRHCSGNHKRETIAFSKTRQNGVERLAILVVWRNYMKSFSENRRDGTPAMKLRLAEKKLTPAEVLRKRLFTWRIRLPERWLAYYRRLVATGPRGTSRPHALRFAF